MRPQPVTIVGAGLAGSLLAIMLARRGFSVTLIERRGDPRDPRAAAAAAAAGRSINLALAARGIAALEHAALMPEVRPLMLAMRGRMVHEPGRTPVLLPYGQRADEVIHSVSRAALNRVLVSAAAATQRVRLRFETACEHVDPAAATLSLRQGGAALTESSGAAAVLATDGAGSAVRASLAAHFGLRVSEEALDHDYKELTLPPNGGAFALAPDALHVWPRRGFMLIALPNTDRSFTATLFLPREGAVSFASLTDDAAVQAFFAREFADAVPLIPHLLREFREHPQGRLGTVRTHPWHAGARVLLLGDAAHAIVPFHGQGMNAAFEDCLALERLLDAHESWATLFEAFEAQRRPNADAIAQMALQNYTEMRSDVLDPRFLQRQRLSAQLHRAFPDRFIPRYGMVMFHPEIPYAEALRRGQVQQQILDELEAAGETAEAPDLERARRLIEARL